MRLGIFHCIFMIEAKWVKIMYCALQNIVVHHASEYMDIGLLVLTIIINYCLSSFLVYMVKKNRILP